MSAKLYLNQEIQRLDNQGIDVYQINIIGHSWGGATAYNLASALGASGKKPPVQLVTLDPVSRSNYHTPLPANTKWLNVYSLRNWMCGCHGDLSNLVGLIGGQWGAESSASNKVVDANHGDAEANLKKAIESKEGNALSGAVRGAGGR